MTWVVYLLMLVFVMGATVADESFKLQLQNSSQE